MNWPYIAGFFDGEGTVNFRMGKGPCPSANMCQTGEAGKKVFEEMQEFLRERGLTTSMRVQLMANARRKELL